MALSVLPSVAIILEFPMIWMDDANLVQLLVSIYKVVYLVEYNYYSCLIINCFPVRLCVAHSIKIYGYDTF